MTTVTLLKYHGSGNDFLVGLDPLGLAEAGSAPAPGLVAALCDRHEGIGADGLILVRRRRGDGVAMELYNSDGTRAETSGNGLRCLALALVDTGTVQSRRVSIETDGGAVTAQVGARLGRCAAVTVDMGEVIVGEVQECDGAGRFRPRAVRMGNPHLVLIGSSLEGVDVAEVGRPLEHAVAGGQNVEIVAPDGEGGLELLVWERGAGATRACGSGSCAAAAAAREARLVGDHVVVHNPGGDLVVDLSGPPQSPRAQLTGPACRIARVEYELEAVGA